MSFHKLRIYEHGSEDRFDSLNGNSSSDNHQPLSEPRVKVSVAQVLPLLADAMACKRLWLFDFQDDSMTISQDLYEVLLAYQRMRTAA